MLKKKPWGLFRYQYKTEVNPLPTFPTIPFPPRCSLSLSLSNFHMSMITLHPLLTKVLTATQHRWGGYTSSFTWNCDQVSFSDSNNSVTWHRIGDSRWDLISKVVHVRIVSIKPRRWLHTQFKQVVGVSVDIVEYVVRLLFDFLIPPIRIMWWSHIILKL